MHLIHAFNNKHISKLVLIENLFKSVFILSFQIKVRKIIILKMDIRLLKG